MDQRSCIDSPYRRITFNILASSRGRSWQGCDAALYEVSDGSSNDFMPNNTVTMHVGRPAAVAARCGQIYEHRVELPGDLEIVPAGYWRTWETATPTVKLRVSLTPALMNGVAESLGMNADGVSLELRLHFWDKPIQYILSSLCAELQAENPIGRLYAESLATALAARLLSQYRGTRSPIGGLPKRQLQQLLEYIDENVARDLSLQELASVVSASGSHFNVLFKKSTGSSPHQFVLRARVRRAVDLITGSSLELSEIALRCGFANQSHMSRSVRRFHGITPAELRRQRE